MTKTKTNERRLHPRISQQLPFKVVANGYDFATYTKNISCVGAYCHINKYVPPFTKVMVRLSLPMMRSDKNRYADVECKGVIVRTEDEKNGGYNVAIFFNGIKDACRSKITSYINHILPPDTSTRKL